MRTFSGFFLLLLPTTILSQHLPSEARNLKGPVKSLRYKEYSFNTPEDSIVRSNYLIEFNTDYNPILLVNYDTLDKETSRTHYSYNPSMQQIKMAHFENAELQRVDSLFYKNPSDKYYNLLKSYDATGQIQFIQTISLNRNRLPVKAVSKNNSGEIIYQDKMARDRKGNVIKSVLLGIDYNNPTDKRKLKYNSQNQLVLYKIKGYGINDHVEAYAYNTFGNVTTHTLLDKELGLYTIHYNYEYDLHGNWTSRIKTTYDRIDSRETCKIEYYQKAILQD